MPGSCRLCYLKIPMCLKLKIAKMKGVHLLNTTALLAALFKAGVLPEGRQLIEQINAARRTPMRPIEEPAQTKKIRSTWLRRITDAG